MQCFKLLTKSSCVLLVDITAYLNTCTCAKCHYRIFCSLCAGKMKGLAFIKDPDGYWIEILNPNTKLWGEKICTLSTNIFLLLYNLLLVLLLWFSVWSECLMRIASFNLKDSWNTYMYMYCFVQYKYAHSKT